MRRLSILFAALLVLGMAPKGFSQAMTIGASGEVAPPMGSFGSAANLGFGATAYLEMSKSETRSFYGRLGYLVWSGKKIANVSASSNFSAIPAMVGGKTYFGKGSTRFFATGEAGIHLFRIKSKVVVTNPITGQVLSSSSTSASSAKLSVAPGAGVEFGGATKFIVSARFNYVTSGLSYLGLRIGAVFGGARR
ncbi:MAG: hypothetical protein D6814_07245 [Calditrichaeota bacterium]|nr:MAG: hypothetical protein D6814_07245 [Calditrichota bacterium]